MPLAHLGRFVSTDPVRLPLHRYAVGIFLALFVGLVFTNHFIFDDDPHKCQALARTGKFYEGRWIPDGCATIGYGSGQINDCARGEKRKIVFAGESPVQEIFWNIVSRLDKSIVIPPSTSEPQDRQFSKGNIELEFISDKWLNGTKVVHRVEDLRDGKSIKPMLTVIGGGRSFIETSNDVDGYKAAVERLTDLAFSGEHASEAPRPSIISSLHDGPGDLLLFTPAVLSRSEHLAYSNQDAYAQADEKLASLTVARPQISVLWSFNDILMSGEPEPARWQADMLLNMRCNANVYHWPPNSGVCCGVWRMPNWIQSLFLMLGLLILPGAVLLDFATSVFSRNESLQGFAAFSAVISLQYITDRSHIFEQVLRLDWHLSNGLMMLGVSLFVGLISMRRCRPAGKPVNGRAVDQPFLPREQTDEWKGWMQLCIIIYHYNMGWKATWLWEIVRMAVSSYLFLTGFGHTLYHLQKNDYSFKRFVNVMLRTNLLPCTLAYVMNTRWLLYYYMPLSTFWYVVTFATLAIGREYNKNTWALLAKIAASAAIVDIFLSTKDLAGTVTKFFKITCRISFDADEFFGHRVSQDRYIVYVGMVAAIFFIWIKDVLANKRQDLISRTVLRRFPALKHLTVAFCALGFMIFWWYLQKHVESQPTFSKLQPYISFIPILTFTVLRNAHPILRNWHSAAFAWLGRYSGEMYVMQNHIWLAGDQEAILRSGLFHGNETVLGDRWRDLLIITPLYLIACSIIGDSTGLIATWFLQEHKPANKGEAPTSDVEIGLLSEAGESEEVREKVIQKPVLWQRLTLSRPSLKWRVFWLLAGMWVLNRTYT